MNSEHPATPWVEVALITLSASEKVIGHGNTMQQPHTHTLYTLHSVHTVQYSVEQYPGSDNLV